MTDIVLTPITSGYNVQKINTNFDVLEEVINEDILHLKGGNNTMLQPLDMNSYAIINARIDLDNPGSLITVGEADARYYNVEGDTLTGPMDVDGQNINNLPIPTLSHQPVRKDQFDLESQQRVASDLSIRADFTAADANLQQQLTGNIPLEASAFSPISWHDQSVDNSVNIPNNKNAWSFGPTMTISPGQTVTVGENSFWTIANGEVNQ